MRRIVLPCLLAILLAAGLAAQTATAPASAPFSTTLDAATTESLVRLGGQLMLAGKAYEYDRVLADEIGPRLTGSPNYAKAAEWATDEFKKMGLRRRAFCLRIRSVFTSRAMAGVLRLRPAECAGMSTI